MRFKQILIVNNHYYEILFRMFKMKLFQKSHLKQIIKILNMLIKLLKIQIIIFY